MTHAFRPNPNYHQLGPFNLGKPRDNNVWSYHIIRYYNIIEAPNYRARNNNIILYLYSASVLGGILYVVDVSSAVRGPSVWRVGKSSDFAADLERKRERLFRFGKRRRKYYTHIYIYRILYARSVQPALLLACACSSPTYRHTIILYIVCTRMLYGYHIILFDTLAVCRSKYNVSAPHITS